MNMKYKIDTHTHTIVSGHAYNTMNEMIKAAMIKGLDILCITEHGPAMPGAPHPYYFSNLKVITKELFPVCQNGIYFKDKFLRVINGMEANVIDLEGNTDYEFEELGDHNHLIKYIIASMHYNCVKGIENASEKDITNAYLNILNNKKYVTTLGHIDDERFACDYEKVVKAAKENDVLIEVNNSSNSPTSFRLNSKENTLEYLQLCKENGNMIVLGSDAHWDEDIANFEYVIPLLKKVNFPEELIINNDKELFISFLDKKYKERKIFYGLEE